MDPQVGTEVQVRLLGLQLCAKVPGGTARYTAELARALAGQKPQGATLTLVTRPGCAAAHELGVPVQRLRAPSRPAQVVGLLDPVLARLWERGLPPRVPGAGVVHAPTMLMPPAGARQRLVVTVHDLVAWTHPQTLTPRGVRFHRRMGQRIARHADLVVTPTEAVAAAVRATLAPRAPVVAVHSGLAMPDLPGDAPARRRALGVPDAAYLLFVGTAEPRKGLDRLVRALADPVLAGRELVVAGPPGWGAVRVDELAAQAGVAGRVRVLGRVTDLDLAALYAGAAALALPSQAEGFGFPVLEAMHYGTPVVVSDDPALVEVAGPAAWVAPGGVDALAHTLAEAAAPAPARAERIRVGVARAAEFNWARTARRMWGLYAGLAG